MPARLQPAFRSTATDGSARLGLLQLYRKGLPLETLRTPALLPVVNLMTSTTPRGGGIWKYILRRLFKANAPMMTQALQFLDFGLTGEQVYRWTHNPAGSVVEQYLAHYEQEHTELGISAYRGVLFLDSGGFKLLGNHALDLSPYGILSGDGAWQGILDIQDGLGGDVYVSLDYPFKPALDDEEAVELIARSHSNALAALRALSRRGGTRPQFYVVCHGRTYEEMRRSVARFFAALIAEGLGSVGIGLAIGSLVPLRTVNNKSAVIISIINGARDGIPEALRGQVPIHVLGITGTMIPVLAYLGVDSFDSSSYVQNARSLEYFHPERRRKARFLEMETRDLPCRCPECRGCSYRRMHQVLVGANQDGLVKSQVYAAIALHNLHWDNQLVANTRQAIAQGDLEDFLVEHARLYPASRPAVEVLAQNTTAMGAKLSRQTFAMSLKRKLGAELELPDGPIDLTAYEPGPPPWLRTAGPAALPETDVVQARRRISLKYTPDSFSIPDTWAPQPGKDILLVLPCSDVKPYRESRTHQAVLTHLAERLASVGRIQKVTLSGLYGPVPEEFEGEPAVLEYDFRLSPADESQIALCTRRLAEFLQRHEARFRLRLGYATSRAYRDVLLRTARLVPGFALMPSATLKQQLLTELFRREHLDALARLIEQEVLIVDRSAENLVTAG